VLPLGSLPAWGREGSSLTTTTEDFLNNSYIEEFYRAFFLIPHVPFIERNSTSKMLLKNIIRFVS
jgi:hypothetical protein